MLEMLLKRLRKTDEHIKSGKKSAEWKVMTAYYMKRHTAVTNSWLSSALNMGATQGLSRYVTEFDRGKRYERKEYKELTLNIST